MIYIDFYTTCTAYKIYRSVRPLSQHIASCIFLVRSLAATRKSPVQNLKSNILSELSKFCRSIKRFLEYFFLRSFVMKNGPKIMLLDVLLMFSVDQLYKKITSMIRLESIMLHNLLIMLHFPNFLPIILIFMLAR